MAGQKWSRRNVLSAGSSLAGLALAGCASTADDSASDEPMNDIELEGKNSSFTLRPEGPGIDFEQLVFNPDDGEFYLADRGGLGAIYRGRETYGEHRNASFAAWDTTDGGFESDAVIRVDKTRIGSLELTRGSGQQKVGWVDAWFYDTGSDRTRVGVSVVTHQNDAFGLGIWSEDEFGSERYARYGGEEWVDSGIERIPGRGSSSAGPFRRTACGCTSHRIMDVPGKRWASNAETTRRSTDSASATVPE